MPLLPTQTAYSSSETTVMVGDGGSQNFSKSNLAPAGAGPLSVGEFIYSQTSPSGYCVSG